MTEEVIQLVSEESNHYTKFINCPDHKINKVEIRFFILIVSDYDKKPSNETYWGSGDDLRNTTVYNSM